MIYSDTYDLLLKASRQIVNHRQHLAKSTIDRTIRDYVGPRLSNEELLGHLLAEALSRRVDRQLLECRNIYVEEFDVPQTELFYSMAEAVPFVSASHSVANQFAVSAVAGEREITILDIGVGRGQQLGKLLQMLAEREDPVEAVTVIAVDPVEQNVLDSREVVNGLRSTLPFSITCHSRCEMIEKFSDSDFEEIGEMRRGGLIVNSAFTLHHTAHDADDDTARTRMLGRIAALRPDAFTLVEPSSNHDTEDLPRRVHNAWLHYGTVFALVDESGIAESHKHLIKQMFFGREIQDIFGVSDRFRSERHELYESWLLRLHRAGFSPVPAPSLTVTLPDYCSATVDDGLVRLNYRDLTVVAVFASCAREIPKPGTR